MQWLGSDAVGTPRLEVRPSGADASTQPPRPVAARHILGMRVDATSYAHAAHEILGWAHHGESRYVCVATVNNVIEAYDDPAYGAIMEAADLVTPDGMPLVWALRLLGVPTATRVYGPDLTPVVCQLAAEEGVPVGFYGGAQDVLEELTVKLTRRFPGLKVTYQASPPFRPLTADEERRTLEDLDRSGARILFVGLGTPKQERWMAAHKQVNAVMLGVGAAFDFLAGTKRQAPRLVQRLGLEWLYRLVYEPRRLWRRYLYRNPRFVILFAAQLLRERRPARRAHDTRSPIRDAVPTGGIAGGKKPDRLEGAPWKNA
jgi:N-acetylglucosaminyldiphosphoundecaprenol N-acetyl-beta-D-mannosaminyltransferase